MVFLMAAVYCGEELLVEAEQAPHELHISVTPAYTLTADPKRRDASQQTLLARTASVKSLPNVIGLANS